MNTQEKIFFSIKKTEAVKSAKSNFKKRLIVLKDLFSSIRNNLAQTKFNKTFLIPYGIIRLILIVNETLLIEQINTLIFICIHKTKVLLIGGFIVSLLIPVNDSVFFFGPSNNDSGLNVPQNVLYKNFTARTAFMSIDLLGLCLSILILIVGLANVINFDSLKHYPWIVIVRR